MCREHQGSSDRRCAPSHLTMTGAVPCLTSLLTSPFHGSPEGKSKLPFQQLLNHLDRSGLSSSFLTWQHFSDILFPADLWKSHI